MFSSFEDTETESEEELAFLKQHQEQLIAESRRAVSGTRNLDEGQNVKVAGSAHQELSDQPAEEENVEEAATRQQKSDMKRPRADDEAEEEFEKDGGAPKRRRID